MAKIVSYIAIAQSVNPLRTEIAFAFKIAAANRKCK